MLRAGQECPEKPTMPRLDVRMLRVQLIAEELLELAEAFGVTLEIKHGEISVAPNRKILSITNAYDATLDLMVVVIGTGVAMGVDLEPGWEEVHRSNMSKFIDGHKHGDGKWIKGPSYSPANLGPILEAQINPPPLPTLEGV